MSIENSIFDLATSMANTSQQESTLVAEKTETIATDGDLQAVDSAHSTLPKIISHPLDQHLDSNILKPIQKQSKFSQARGFPFTGIGRSVHRSGRRRSDPSGGVSAVQSERTAMSVLSSIVTAPFHLPSLVSQSGPSLSQLEEGTAYDDPPSKVSTANVVPAKLEKWRTQRFSIDSESQEKTSLLDVQPRPPQKNVSFLFSNVTLTGFPKENSRRRSKYIDLNSG
jgi:hypothetical protein